LKTIQLVLGILTALIALGSCVYASFTARGKGPILNNTYLWGTPEEKRRADKKAEYRQVTVVFFGLALLFGLLALQIFTLWKVLWIPMGITVAFLVVYAVVSSVQK
jgi:hypothetical protein